MRPYAWDCPVLLQSRLSLGFVPYTMGLVAIFTTQSRITKLSCVPAMGLSPIFTTQSRIAQGFASHMRLSPYSLLPSRITRIVASPYTGTVTIFTTNPVSIRVAIRPVYMRLSPYSCSIPYY
ncbi:hypothetical protein AVEN_110828-1 [Araneus ventricosus]|uniref:Uncharacterized protein n=1 Tax=Araneus ventricosus TaxID=182803 RepID=A0A4Y2WJI4_ARAVE|nr:hypothetical protein AVEN_110828-1 [Araneus ventricosus]